MDDEQKIALLRVQLYMAAQILKGDNLVAFTDLIREIAMLLDIVPLGAPTYDHGTDGEACDYNSEEPRSE